MTTTDVLPDLRLPRWLMPSLAAASSLVLASHVFYVTSLARAGVRAGDGDAAYGVDAGDVPGRGHSQVSTAGALPRKRSTALV
ncbi:hypothetical protein [Quadrisphaera granulorum]|nr:hypothetical protein [Quadrisphaera granulorum]